MSDRAPLCRWLAPGVGAVLALMAGRWLATTADAREFRAADIQEESYPTVQALRFMDQLVTERSNGRHRIRVFHSRQLGEESQTIEQTRVGAIDMDRKSTRLNSSHVSESRMP